ncbi:hypothetical protein EVAR_16657_1 [Eumeta japonica]|uniref:Uncharacterized protein n=1 Tax=Eumeta variegata TaxID=151549 RepID=A0A4C1V0W6_EUMVA|nr:hypothetical protein EVAR_16657_1 [Eumeta japonica]
MCLAPLRSVSGPTSVSVVAGHTCFSLCARKHSTSVKMKSTESTFNFTLEFRIVSWTVMMFPNGLVRAGPAVRPVAVGLINGFHGMKRYCDPSIIPMSVRNSLSFDELWTLTRAGKVHVRRHVVRLQFLPGRTYVGGSQ